MAHNRSVSFVSVIVSVASIFIILFGLRWLSPVLTSILFAFTLTLLIVPLIEWLRKKGMHRYLAIVVVSIGVVLILVFLVQLINISIQQLIEKLPEYEKLFVEKLASVTEYLESTDWYPQVSTNYRIHDGSVRDMILAFLSSLIINIANFLFFLFTLLLMVVASDDLMKWAREKFSKDSQLSRQFTTWSKGIQVQYKVQTTDNLVSALLATGLFFIMDIDFAILWGVFTFFLAYIPNVGVIIAGIPPVLIAFILHGFGSAALTAILLTAINLIMDNVVTPRFMGSEVKIRAIFIFLSFMIWTYIFGPLGAFLSMPITLAIRNTLSLFERTKIVADMLSVKKEVKNEKHTKK